MDSDRRIRLAVDLTPGAPSQFFAGLSGDVMRGGVFVATYKDVREGESVLLELDLPQGTALATGKVRWKRPLSADEGPGLIVAFDEVSAEGRDWITEYCAKVEPLYYDCDDRISQVG
jgi:Tfp pilus assembly protein PilZ